MQRQRQSDAGYGDRRPDVGSTNGHARIASVAGQTMMIRGNTHQGVSSSNIEQRYAILLKLETTDNIFFGTNKVLARSENGWVATWMPLRITVPRHGGNS